MASVPAADAHPFPNRDITACHEVETPVRQATLAFRERRVANGVPTLVQQSTNGIGDLDPFGHRDFAFNTRLVAGIASGSIADLGRAATS